MSSNLRDHLQSLYDSYGSLTPKMVVEEARPTSHPLHTHFEWDDSIAGEKYREHQASELIRSVKIKYVRRDKEQTEDVRLFVSVRDPEGGYAYHPVDVIAEDPLLSQIVLRDIEREWVQLRNKYGHIKEFFEIVQKDIEAKKNTSKERMIDTNVTAPV